MHILSLMDFLILLEIGYNPYSAILQVTQDPQYLWTMPSMLKIFCYPNQPRLPWWGNLPSAQKRSIGKLYENVLIIIYNL